MGRPHGEMRDWVRNGQQIARESRWRCDGLGISPDVYIELDPSLLLSRNVISVPQIPLSFRSS